MSEFNTIIFANPKQRFLAHLIDVMLISLITYILIIAMPLYDFNRTIIFKEAVYLILSALYYIYFTSSNLKGTIGKKIFNLIVVDYNFNGINRMQALNRYLGYLFSYLTAGLGFLLLFTNSKKQCLQDNFAKTYVIKASS
jgi:uncharacterized RDD family membrane protein YckC